MNRVVSAASSMRPRSIFWELLEAKLSHSSNITSLKRPSKESVSVKPATFSRMVSTSFSWEALM